MNEKLSQAIAEAKAANDELKRLNAELNATLTAYNAATRACRDFSQANAQALDLHWRLQQMGLVEE